VSLWQERPDNSPSTAHSVDIVFRIRCQQLPVDHAEELANALLHHAPWIKHIENVGVHSVHVAGSQNGWERPDASAGEQLMLSRRTRLRIRIAEHHAQKLIVSLTDRRMHINGVPLNILSGSVRKFDTAGTLFARSCSFNDAAAPEDDESVFTDKVIDACEQAGFSPNKVLCGKSGSIQTEKGPIHVRSVMIGDVPIVHSLPLQEQGLGRWRLLGCGLLIPHKDTAPVV